jgi:hypothetical protein
MGHQLLGDLFGERRLKPSSDVDGREFLVLAPVVCFEFRALELLARLVRYLPVSGRTRTHPQPLTWPERRGRRPRDQYVVVSRMRRCDSEHQTRC